MPLPMHVMRIYIAICTHFFDMTLLLLLLEWEINTIVHLVKTSERMRNGSSLFESWKRRNSPKVLTFTHLWRVWLLQRLLLLLLNNSTTKTSSSSSFSLPLFSYSTVKEGRIEECYCTVYVQSVPLSVAIKWNSRRVIVIYLFLCHSSLPIIFSSFVNNGSKDAFGCTARYERKKEKNKKKWTTGVLYTKNEKDLKSLKRNLF